MIKLTLFAAAACFVLCATTTPAVHNKIEQQAVATTEIVPGAARTELYLPRLQGKKVGVFANHTSLVGDKNIVDVLIQKGVRVSVIFGPEHGFRGKADAGQKIGNYVDEETGIPVVSLYGSKHRPSAEDLKDVDVMLFDIQDVGTRFYTYISSLEEFMEAAIAYNKPLIVLDRPNPNGFYVDGPVLDKAFKSFVGMQPIPTVYGMTIGEYANMLVGEKWLSNKSGKLQLTIIPCSNYTHSSRYVLPVPPSPNLPDMQSVYAYPSTCLFEGTILSEGRGTDKPFRLFGHPMLPNTLTSFTPRSKPGATNPKLKDQLCYGWVIDGTPEAVSAQMNNKVQLKYVLEAYRQFPNKDSFFLRNTAFNRLAGTDVLMKQIKEGKTEAEIRQSWEPALSDFKKIRKKYLIYKD